MFQSDDHGGVRPGGSRLRPWRESPRDGKARLLRPRGVGRRAEAHQPPAARCVGRDAADDAAAHIPHESRRVGDSRGDHRGVRARGPDDAARVLPGRAGRRQRRNRAEMLPQHRRRVARAVRRQVRGIQGAAGDAELRQIRRHLLLRRVAAHHARDASPQQRALETIPHLLPHPHLPLVHRVLHHRLLRLHAAGAVGARRHDRVQRHARPRRVAGHVHTHDQQGGHLVHHDPAPRRGGLARSLPLGL